MGDIYGYYVNTETGELETLWSYDLKYETNDYKKVINDESWKRINKRTFHFYEKIGKAYMEEQEYLNASDE